MKRFFLPLIVLIIFSCNQNKVSQIENLDNISNLWFKADSTIIKPRNQSYEKVTKESSDFSLIVNETVFICISRNPL